MRYVYLLQSEAFPGQRYVGITSDLRQRLAEHNAAMTWMMGFADAHPILRQLFSVKAGPQYQGHNYTWLLATILLATTSVTGVLAGILLPSNCSQERYHRRQPEQVSNIGGTSCDPSLQSCSPRPSWRSHQQIR